MPEGGTGGTVSFQRGIQPIFDAKCIVCHQPGGIAFLRGITLELTEQVSYDQLVSQRSVQDPDRIFVVPGDASSSLLFLKVSTDAPPIGDRMPLDANPLSETEIALIRDWIDRGALNN